MELQLENVNCGYGKDTILQDVSFTVRSGDFFCLLGPNGVGKTTLFKTILSLVKLQSGRILIDGTDIASWPRQKLACKIGYVPQAHTAVFDFKVIDVITMGRAAHLGLWKLPSKTDFIIAEEILTNLSITHLRNRIYSEISGGERQLVLIARALAQKPEFLIMDEPTSNLDYGKQIYILDYIKKLIRKTGLGVIMTTHSPNHVLQYGSKVAAINKTRDIKIGAPETIINSFYIKSTYHINVQMIKPKLNDNTQSILCVPLKIQDFDKT